MLYSQPTSNSQISNGRRIPLAVLLSLLLTAFFTSDPAIAAEADGFIHGTVTTKKGQAFTGLLRWDNEEAFWGDHFNSGKEDTPYLDDTKRPGKKSKRQYEFFGKKINIDWGNWSDGRQFVARFGDIQSIKVLGSDEARLFMKDGSEIHVEGTSNDVDATIKIRDASMGDVEIDWKKIDTIAFSAAPSSAKTWGDRLRGTVETSAGTFSGYVQWDKQECISVDKLDGESDDIKVSLEMGRIRSIERRGKRSSDVVLLDGRKLNVSGSNDVDDDNRGILVEDDRYGRVEIPWMTFKKVTFETAQKNSGPTFDSYTPKGQLRGTLTTKPGTKFSGRIVFDLDEERDWEMLDGDLDDVSYSIPFGLIEWIRPRNSHETEIKLRGGKTLRLSEGHDVSDENDGILVMNDKKKTYIEWEDVKLIEFDS